MTSISSRTNGEHSCLAPGAAPFVFALVRVGFFFLLSKESSTTSSWCEVVFVIGVLLVGCNEREDGEFPFKEARPIAPSEFPAVWCIEKESKDS